MHYEHISDEEYDYEAELHRRDQIAELRELNSELKDMIEKHLERADEYLVKSKFHAQEAKALALCLKTNNSIIARLEDAMLAHAKNMLR